MAGITINKDSLNAIRGRTDGLETFVAFSRHIRETTGVVVHPDHLNNIEKGYRKPSLKLAKAMCQALGVPLVAILSTPSDEAVA